MTTRSYIRDIAVEVYATTARNCNSCLDAYHAAYAAVYQRGFRAQQADRLAKSAASLWLGGHMAR